MVRKIIKIDKDKCNGCGLCVTACHEGAIGLVDGKATLLRDDYCDGLGDCLPACPTKAITFETREALEYNETAVKENMEKKNIEKQSCGDDKLPCGCSGTNVKSFDRGHSADTTKTDASSGGECSCGGDGGNQEVTSQLMQWPVQIKLVPTNAPYFDGANLLIAADCTAYAYANFHKKFIRNHITLIGCPKLDEGDYSEKLTDIIKNNNIKSVSIVRMEVPCCGGIENAAKTALQKSGKFIPWQVYTVSTDGKLLD